MRRFALAASLAVSASCLLLAPALAWSPPSVGQACKGLRGSGPEVELIAGNFMGGKAVRDGVVDRKSFQACFARVENCERWLAHHAARFPLQPQIAACTPVSVR